MLLSFRSFVSVCVSTSNSLFFASFVRLPLPLDAALAVSSFNIITFFSVFRLHRNAFSLAGWWLFEFLILAGWTYLWSVEIVVKFENLIANVWLHIREKLRYTMNGEEQWRKIRFSRWKWIIWYKNVNRIHLNYGRRTHTCASSKNNGEVHFSEAFKKMNSLLPRQYTCTCAVFISKYLHMSLKFQFQQMKAIDWRCLKSSMLNFSLQKSWKMKVNQLRMK